MIETLSTISENSPFFTSQAAIYIFVILIANTVVLFIVAILCAYLWAKELGRPSEPVFGKAKRDEHLRDLINGVLDKRERDRAGA